MIRIIAEHRSTVAEDWQDALWALYGRHGLYLLRGSVQDQMSDESGRDYALVVYRYFGRIYTLGSVEIQTVDGPYDDLPEIPEIWARLQ